MPIRLTAAQAKQYGIRGPVVAAPKPSVRDRFNGYASSWEQEFALYLVACGLYRLIRYEPWQFVLIPGAKPVRYKPDFLAVPKQHRRWIIFEVKGYWRPKDRVIMKLCADRWGKEFEILGVTKVNKQWDFESFS